MHQEETFQQCARKFNLQFKNFTLLIRAFTHCSYLNEHRDSRLEHNERLEFLGDAVLEIVVTDYLYNKFRYMCEGEMTALRSALVSTTTLTQVATNLDLNSYILLSKGEAKNIGRARECILANTVEALIGAIYIDLGQAVAARFISEHILSLLPQLILAKQITDPKTKLQMKTQTISSKVPEYTTLKEEGSQHNKMFTVGVKINGEHIAIGQSSSKKNAEIEAARKALEIKGW